MSSNESPKPYHTGKIYKIVNINDPDEFYIGSTKNVLRVRWQGHKSICSKNPPTKLHQLMNELGYECFKMVLIEDYPCENRDQLRMREDYWISLLKPKLNHMKAYQSSEDKAIYDQKYNEEHKEHQKKWRENNQEVIKEKNRIYQSKNKERLNEVSRRYYEEHKEDSLMKCKIRYEKKKDEINAAMRIKLSCHVCGKIISKRNMLRHVTNKHGSSEHKYAVIEFIIDD